MVAILARMIITPLVLLPLMIPATKYDVQRVFDEYVFFPPCFVGSFEDGMLTDWCPFAARCSWCRTCC